MNPQTLQTVSQVVVAVGVTLTALGGLGAYYFSNAVEPALQTVSHVVVAVGVTFTALGGLGAYYFGKKTEPTHLTRQDLDDAMQANLERLLARLSTAEPQEGETFPGFSHHMVVAIHQLRENRRKFLFDVGELTRSRISIYMDRDSFLCLRFLDAQGETYTVKVAQGPETFQLGEFVYLAAEVGDRGHSSFLRLLADGKLLASQDLPFGVGNLPLDMAGGVLGADLGGKNGGRFDVTEIATYSSTLTTESMRKMLQYFANKTHDTWVAFAGKQWMRIGNTQSGDHLRNVRSEENTSEP